ncbi:hypothetical protein V3481_009825 [Fusarium oxysporum f. sp. vasinfectum]
MLQHGSRMLFQPSISILWRTVAGSNFTRSHPALWRQKQWVVASGNAVYKYRYLGQDPSPSLTFFPTQTLQMMVPLSLFGKECHAARGVSDVVGSQRIKRTANAVHANGSHSLTTAGGGCASSLR